MKSLLEQYIFSRNIIRIFMPVIAIVWVLAAIAVMIVRPEIWLLSLIFLGIAAIVAIMCVFMLKYLNKKIKELTEREILNNDSTVGK